ncbi:MAG: AAA family ATPase [Patescibacteria group bacterium]
MLHTIAVAKLLRKNLKAPKWLIKDLIPAQGITILSGHPGNFKTWILIEIAKSVSLGEKLFDQFDCLKGKVLIIDEENNLSFMKERFKLVNMTNKGVIHISSKHGFRIDKLEDEEDLLRFIKAKKIRLVCIDSFVRIHGKDENIAGQVSDVFSLFNKITNLGVTVIITHHLRKGNERGQSNINLRGSSDILAAVDCHLMVAARNKKTIIEVTQGKLRIAEEMDTFQLKIDKSDKSVKFSYAGTTKQEEDKNDMAWTKIIEEIKDNGIKSRQDLVESVKSLIGESATDELLDRMVKDKKLEKEVGVKGKHFYRLT